MTAQPDPLKINPPKSQVPPSAGQQPAPSGVEYIPVFDTGEQAFTTWYCRPKRVKADGTLVAEDILLSEGLEDRAVNEKLVSTNMIRTLDGAVSLGRRLFNRGEAAATILVPINGMALTRKEIVGAFTNACRRIEDEIKAMLIFEVTNIADTVRMSYLDDIAIILFLFCRGYIGRISPKITDLRIFGTCNYHGVSLPLMDKPWPAATVNPYLTNFVANAQSNRLKAYLHGVGTPAIAEMATIAGVNFLDGIAMRPKVGGLR
ncbi:MAG: hypothetical protein HQL37_03730 [Alphaproteobacteria bacterium]|nr:hypothetical protein [Alphaproteobacteria bacterium]